MAVVTTISQVPYPIYIIVSRVLHSRPNPKSLKVWSTFKIRGTRVPQNAIVPLGRPKPYSIHMQNVGRVLIRLNQ